MTSMYSNHLKSIAIVVCIFFLASIFIGFYVERFRFDKELRWIYETGKSFSFWTFLLAPTIGLVNGIWIIVVGKIKWKDYFIWAVLSFAPILYFVIMMTQAML